MDIVYNASNTSQQVIDTFDPATTKMLHYYVNVEDSVARAVSDLTVTHDGVTVSELQMAVSTNDVRPAELIVNVVNGVGRILSTPLRAPARYTLSRTESLANLYSEHTVSGRHIPSTEGIGVYFSAVPNMTVRQPNNNSFGNASVFMTANTLGPKALFAIFWNDSGPNSGDLKTMVRLKKNFSASFFDKYYWPLLFVPLLLLLISPAAFWFVFFVPLTLSFWSLHMTVYGHDESGPKYKGLLYGFLSMGEHHHKWHHDHPADTTGEGWINSIILLIAHKRKSER